jgi:hypothetical protein
MLGEPWQLPWPSNRAGTHSGRENPCFDKLRRILVKLRDRH